MRFSAYSTACMAPAFGDVIVKFFTLLDSIHEVCMYQRYLGAVPLGVSENCEEYLCLFFRRTGYKAGSRFSEWMVLNVIKWETKWAALYYLYFLRGWTVLAQVYGFTAT